MDGTFVDLYGVNGWLDDLLAENTRPYDIAKPLVNLSAFARLLNKVQKNGNEIAVISWLSKDSTEEYDKAVTKSKLDYLSKHLPSVKFDEINIVPYGTPKENFGTENDILFDDEEKNRTNWNGTAYKPQEIFEILSKMA